MSAFHPLRTLAADATKMPMRLRLKKRRGMQPLPEPQGSKNYLRRITPFALLCFPFWLALPFIGDSDRVALVMSGTVPPWKLVLWLVLVLLMSFLGSAVSDWDDRRKAAKASHD